MLNFITMQLMSFFYTWCYDLSTQPFGTSHEQWQSHSQHLGQRYGRLDLSVLSSTVTIDIWEHNYSLFLSKRQIQKVSTNI